MDVISLLFIVVSLLFITAAILLSEMLFGVNEGDAYYSWKNMTAAFIALVISCIPVALYDSDPATSLVSLLDMFIISMLVFRIYSKFVQ